MSLTVCRCIEVACSWSWWVIGRCRGGEDRPRMERRSSRHCRSPRVQPSTGQTRLNGLGNQGIRGQTPPPPLPPLSPHPLTHIPVTHIPLDWTSIDGLLPGSSHRLDLNRPSLPIESRGVCMHRGPVPTRRFFAGTMTRPLTTSSSPSLIALICTAFSASRPPFPRSPVSNTAND
jgi:hypothetical protein